MYPHSIITLIWMAFAWLWHLVLEVSLWYFALTIIAWWWSREQYWLELKWRKLDDDEWLDVVQSAISVWNPTTYKNWDLIAPTIIALANAIAWSLLF